MFYVETFYVCSGGGGGGGRDGERLNYVFLCLFDVFFYQS